MSNPASSRGMMHEPIPTKAQWLEWTNAKHKIRSLTLRKLDNAIGEYEKSPTPANEIAVRDAFMAWKREKGPDWAKSERNRYPYDAIINPNATLFRDLGLTEKDKEQIAFWHTRRAEGPTRIQKRNDQAPQLQRGNGIGLMQEGIDGCLRSYGPCSLRRSRPAKPWPMPCA